MTQARPEYDYVPPIRPTYRPMILQIFLTAF